jgi:hypothetical protein
LLRKSLQAQPAFFPALQDSVFVQYRHGDRNGAEYALELLKYYTQLYAYSGLEDDIRNFDYHVHRMEWRE